MAIKPEIDSVSPFPPIAGGGTTTKPISGNSYAIGLKNGGKIYVEIDSVTDTVKVHGNLDVDGILKGIETLTNAGNIKVQTLTSGIKVTGNIETDTLNVLGDIEGQNVKLATIENLAGNQFLDLKTNSFFIKDTNTGQNIISYDSSDGKLKLLKSVLSNFDIDVHELKIDGNNISLENLEDVSFGKTPENNDILIYDTDHFKSENINDLATNWIWINSKAVNADQFDVVYMDATGWHKADRGNIDKLALGFVSLKDPTNTKHKIQFGGLLKIANLASSILDESNSSLNIGEYYFLSSTPGKLTKNKPAGSTFSNPVLFVLDADIIQILAFRPITLNAIAPALSIQNKDDGTSALEHTKGTFDLNSNMNLKTTGEIHGSNFFIGVDPLKLKDLADIDFAFSEGTRPDFELIAWDQTKKKFVDISPSQVLQNNSFFRLANIKDVSFTGLTTGQALIWDGSGFAFGYPTKGTGTGGTGTGGTGDLKKDGTIAMAANFDLGGFKIVNAGVAVSGSELTTLGQITTLIADFLKKDGSIKLDSTFTPSNDFDIVPKKYIDNEIIKIDENSFDGKSNIAPITTGITKVLKYIVDAGATGAFAAKDNQIAIFNPDASAWTFRPAHLYETILIGTNRWIYDGTNWQNASGFAPSTGVSNLDDLADVTVATATTNQVLTKKVGGWFAVDIPQITISATPPAPGSGKIKDQYYIEM